MKSTSMEEVREHEARRQAAVNAACADPTLRSVLAWPALDHLMKLLDAGCEHAVGDCDDRHCFYCGEWLDEDKYRDPKAPDKHHPDCDYLGAKAFVEGLEKPNA